MPPSSGELLAAALELPLDHLLQSPSLLTARGISLVSKSDVHTAVAHVHTLPPDHWLHARPLDTAPLLAEFGWRPTPLGTAMAEYMAWLRRQASPGTTLAPVTTLTPNEAAAAAAGTATAAVSTAGAAASAPSASHTTLSIALDTASGLPMTCHPLAVELFGRRLQPLGQRAVRAPHSDCDGLRLMATECD